MKLTDKYYETIITEYSRVTADYKKLEDDCMIAQIKKSDMIKCMRNHNELIGMVHAVMAEYDVTAEESIRYNRISANLSSNYYKLQFTYYAYFTTEFDYLFVDDMQEDKK